MNKGLQSLAVWWSMNEAQWEITENVPDDGKPVLQFMGSGGSTIVTVGDLREAVKCQETIDKLQAELVAEATRTANEKLRADQMTAQHKTQSELRKAAQEELAKLRADALHKPSVSAPQASTMGEIFDQVEAKALETGTHIQDINNLPQRQVVEINLNWRATFTLTKSGADIINADEDRLYAAVPKLKDLRAKKVYKEGQEVSMQIHTMMNLFGESTKAGCETFCKFATIKVTTT